MYNEEIKLHMNAGSLMKTIRRTTGMTQEEFAKKFEIDLSHFKNIERGTSYPSFKLLMELEQLCDVTIHFSVECDYKVSPRPKRRSRKIDYSKIKVFDIEDFMSEG